MSPTNMQEQKMLTSIFNCCFFLFFYAFFNFKYNAERIVLLSSQILQKSCHVGVKGSVYTERREDYS
jgi:hypothetical protein